MMWENWKVRTDLAKLSWLRPCTGSGWNLLGTTLRPAIPRFWCVQYSFLKKGSCALAILCILCQWNSASCNIPPSHQVFFFLVSLSFFLDKDQNLLFKYIVIALSCNVVYIAIYFAWSREVHSNVGLFAKCEASLRRYENIINFHNKHRIHAELRFLFTKRIN